MCCISYMSRSLLTECQFSLRLKTLVDKKRVIQSRSVTSSKISANFVTLFEGFQQFDGDLNKLQVSRLSRGLCKVHSVQQFVEINETGVSKILKKVGVLNRCPVQADSVLVG